MLVILVTSREYMFIPLDGPYDAATLSGPGYTTEIALIGADGSEPADADYHIAQWLAPEPGDDAEPALLVGAGGGTAYLAGEYMAFTRVTAGSERVVRAAGRVRIGPPAT